MTDTKLSNDQVPKKFKEWLLEMGCPTEKVPTVEVISQMCRAQYYMVWRSLMEQVDTKDAIANKRLQVFCNDVKKFQKMGAFIKKEAGTVVPEQLLLWKQQSVLKRKLEDGQQRVAQVQKELDSLTDKVNGLMSKRMVTMHRSISNAGLRLHFLQQVCVEQRQKSTHLKETRATAESICCFERNDTDIQDKVDKCLASLRRLPSALSSSNASAVSSTGEGEFDEQVWSAIRSGGVPLCTALYERRTKLVRRLNAPAILPKENRKRVIPQSMLAHTSALHCTLALEATKNKLNTKHIQEKSVTLLTDLANYVSGESSELLVLKCEKAYTETRLATLKDLLDDICVGSGVFAAKGDDHPPSRSVAAVNKAIEMKKEELKRSMSMLLSTERKMQTVRECLNVVFMAMRGESSLPRNRQYRGIQLDLPTETISELRQFYSACNSRRRNDVSMRLDSPNSSLGDLIDTNNPRFVDELRMYLKKFDLNSNRQLVLESGEKIWMFETIQASIERMFSLWMKEDLSCGLLYPYYGLKENIKKLIDLLQQKYEIEVTLKNSKSIDSLKIPDVKALLEEEGTIIDRIRKRLKGNLEEIEKIAKIFNSSREILKMWSSNQMKQYISQDRHIDGVSYKVYEEHYKEYVIIV